MAAAEPDRGQRWWMTRCLGILATAALTLAACGGDDDQPAAATDGYDDDQPAAAKDGYDSALTPCEAPQSNGANSNTVTTETCDAPANRDFSDDDVATAIRLARAASFPANVVANPQECSSPLSNSGEAKHPSVLESEGEIYFALYDSRDLITFESADDVQQALDQLREEQPELIPESPSFSVETLEVPALDGLLDQVPEDWQDKLAAQTVTRLSIPADSPGSFDPLRVANALWDAGLLVRPNFIMSKAPGAQHSPANEPVPTRESITNETDRAGDRFVEVAVLDSDFNANGQGAMSLSAGHSTFVAGVVTQSTADASLTEVPFEVGDELRDHITEWRFLELVLNEDSLQESEILNLSAGGYSCIPPGIDSSALTAHNVPPATLTAIATLRDRGTVLVAAAGNDGAIITEAGLEHQRFWPAAVSDFDTIGNLVIGVKATNPDGTTIAEFSNPLPANAACAPGVDIISQFPTGVYNYSEGTHQGNFNGAAIWSGTSFATPYVTAQLVNSLAVEDPQASDHAAKRQQAIDSLRGTCPSG